MRFTLPATLAAGTYKLSATVKFSSGETQKDDFAITPVWKKNSKSFEF